MNYLPKLVDKSLLWSSLPTAALGSVSGCQAVVKMSEAFARTGLNRYSGPQLFAAAFAATWGSMLVAGVAVSLIKVSAYLMGRLLKFMPWVLGSTAHFVGSTDSISLWGLISLPFRIVNQAVDSALWSSKTKVKYVYHANDEVSSQFGRERVRKEMVNAQNPTADSRLAKGAVTIVTKQNDGGYSHLGFATFAVVGGRRVLVSSWHGIRGARTSSPILYLSNGDSVSEVPFSEIKPVVLIRALDYVELELTGKLQTVQSALGIKTAITAKPDPNQLIMVLSPPSVEGGSIQASYGTVIMGTAGIMRYTASTLPGASGSGLFQNGKLVGVHLSGHRKADGAVCNQGVALWDVDFDMLKTSRQEYGSSHRTRHLLEDLGDVEAVEYKVRWKGKEFTVSSELGGSGLSVDEMASANASWFRDAYRDWGEDQADSNPMTDYDEDELADQYAEQEMNRFNSGQLKQGPRWKRSSIFSYKVSSRSGQGFGKTSGGGIAYPSRDSAPRQEMAPKKNSFTMWVRNSPNAIEVDGVRTDLRGPAPQIIRARERLAARRAAERPVEPVPSPSGGGQDPGRISGTPAPSQVSTASPPSASPDSRVESKQLPSSPVQRFSSDQVEKLLNLLATQKASGASQEVMEMCLKNTLEAYVSLGLISSEESRRFSAVLYPTSSTPTTEPSSQAEPKATSKKSRKKKPSKASNTSAASQVCESSLESKTGANSSAAKGSATA